MPQTIFQTAFEITGSSNREDTHILTRGFPLQNYSFLHPSASQQDDVPVLFVSRDGLGRKSSLSPLCNDSASLLSFSPAEKHEDELSTRSSSLNTLHHPIQIQVESSSRSRGEDDGSPSSFLSVDEDRGVFGSRFRAPDADLDGEAFDETSEQESLPSSSASDSRDSGRHSTGLVIESHARNRRIDSNHHPERWTSPEADTFLDIEETVSCSLPSSIVLNSQMRWSGQRDLDFSTAFASPLVASGEDDEDDIDDD